MRRCRYRRRGRDTGRRCFRSGVHRGSQEERRGETSSHYSRWPQGDSRIDCKNIPHSRGRPFIIRNVAIFELFKIGGDPLMTQTDFPAFNTSQDSILKVL